MKKTILIIALSIISLYGKAYDFEVNGFYYNILSMSNLTVQVTCNGEENSSNKTASYSGNITIPKQVVFSGKTFSITGINPYAFINCQIGTLTIPENIVNVANDKYGECCSVGGLYGTFINLIIEDSEIPINCFRGIISGNVTNSVYLGRNINGTQSTEIVYNGGSFNNISFGDKVTELHDACTSCSNLTSVTLPKSIKYLYRTFRSCDNLKTISAHGVEYISSAFIYSGIETIDMPNLKIITDNAFQGCKQLRNITFPIGLVYTGPGGRGITGRGCFDDCSYLESISFPCTLIELNGEYNFTGCNSLKTITIGNPIPIKIAESNFDAITFLNATLKVPVGAKEIYQKADTWKNFSNIIEDSNLLNDIYTINLTPHNYLNGGTISATLSENALQPYDNYLFAKKGAELTLNIKAEQNYKLSKLVINNIDITKDVINNEYKTIVNGGINIDTLDFVYSYEEPTPVSLTIKHAENGCIKQQVMPYSHYDFIIEPADGWKIHTVQYNGNDITNSISDNGALGISIQENDAILSITFESENSSVNDFTISHTKVFAKDNSIIIQEAENGEQVNIYNENGSLVKHLTINSTYQEIQLPTGHVYLISLLNKTIKIVL